MSSTALAFFNGSPTAIGMCVAGIAIVLIGVVPATRAVAAARGLDKIVALSCLAYAIPLAVFGALHLFGPQFVRDLVPRYMPWRMFWVYGIGCALIAAGLSIATGVAVRWSGLLVGILMFLFVAMIYIPGVVRRPDATLTWTIICRESSFGGAGWLLAATAMYGWRGQGQRLLTAVGRTAIVPALLFFGVRHFMHPTALPGVPLARQMPMWVPWREMIGYITGAGLLATGASVLLGRNTRTVAACLGGWILLTVVLIYGPVLIGALSEPGTPAKVEGINYFADTLFFSGVILALARASD